MLCSRASIDSYKRSKPLFLIQSILKPRAVRITMFSNYNHFVQNGYGNFEDDDEDTLPITHGVPQGAILSPLLFCIYLNDLPTATTFCNLESYVDDSKLFMSFPLIELYAAIEKLEQDFHSVAQWFCENHLLINPDKT